MNKPSRWLLLAILLAATAVVVLAFGRTVLDRLRGRQSIEDAIKQYGAAAEARLKPWFGKSGAAYPPAEIALLAFKDERRIELHVLQDAQWLFIRDWPILAASGNAGPKLKRGDRQVPEGVYRILSLNPNSLYHLSMELDYPNAIDRERAAADNRTDLGGEIFIHGSDVSIGCIALGDPAIEELFVLVRRTGIENAIVLIAPNDLRVREPVTDMRVQPAWVPGLYGMLTDDLNKYHTPFKDSSPGTTH